jgi:hypothetical protein
MSKNCNFVVKPHPKTTSKPQDVQNEILIKKFIRQYKKSGIARELKEKSFPQTRGMKARKKRYLGKRRNNRKTN